MYNPFGSPSCFLDAACICQTDDLLMQKGIYNIGGCLSVSTNLHVLLSRHYFSRLWCVFELSAYRKLNPSGRIILTPIHVEAFAANIYIWLHACGLLLVVFRASYDQGGITVLLMFAFVATVLLPLSHSFRQRSLDWQQIMADLDNFDETSLKMNWGFLRDIIAA